MLPPNVKSDLLDLYLSLDCVCRFVVTTSKNSVLSSTSLPDVNVTSCLYIIVSFDLLDEGVDVT